MRGAIAVFLGSTRRRQRTYIHIMENLFPLEILYARCTAFTDRFGTKNLNYVKIYSFKAEVTIDRYYYKLCSNYRGPWNIIRDALLRVWSDLPLGSFVIHYQDVCYSCNTSLINGTKSYSIYGLKHQTLLKAEYVVIGRYRIHKIH